MTGRELAALRNDLAAAERQLESAFDAMDFDPTTGAEGVEQMRLGAAYFHVRCARRTIGDLPGGERP